MTDTRLEEAMEELRGITGREPSPDMVSAMQEMLAALPPDATTRFHDYTDEGDEGDNKKGHDYVLGFIYCKHTMACFTTLYHDGVRASVCYNRHCVEQRLTTARAIEMMLAPNTEDYGNVVVTSTTGDVQIEYMGRRVTLKPGDRFEFSMTEHKDTMVRVVCRAEGDKT